MHGKAFPFVERLFFLAGSARCRHLAKEEAVQQEGPLAEQLREAADLLKGPLQQQQQRQIPKG